MDGFFSLQLLPFFRSFKHFLYIWPNVYQSKVRACRVMMAVEARDDSLGFPCIVNSGKEGCGFLK